MKMEMIVREAVAGGNDVLAESIMELFDTTLHDSMFCRADGADCPRWKKEGCEYADCTRFLGELDGGEFVICRRYPE